MGLEEGSELRHGFIDILRDVVELHVSCAFDEVEVLFSLAARAMRSSLIHLDSATLPAMASKGWVGKTSAK